jgi:hypothetical protein
VSESISQLQATATADAEQYGIPPQLFLDRINAESGWNPNAYNASGATGLGQVLPSTAADPGYGIAPLTDPTDPNANLSFSAQLLSAYHTQTGSWSGALAKYTGQPASNFTQYDTPSTVNGTPATTQSTSMLSGALNFLDPLNLFHSGSSTAQSQTVQTTVSGFIGEEITKAIIVIVGMILLAGALFMLSSSKTQNTVRRIARKGGSVAGEGVASVFDL